MMSMAGKAFDDGPWPRMAHADRAEYLPNPPAGILDQKPSNLRGIERQARPSAASVVGAAGDQ
jgi:hypothetical protein